MKAKAEGSSVIQTQVDQGTLGRQRADTNYIVGKQTLSPSERDERTKIIYGNGKTEGETGVVVEGEQEISRKLKGKKVIGEDKKSNVLSNMESKIDSEAENLKNKEVTNVGK